MAEQFHYDLESARKTLAWLKEKLREIESLVLSEKEALAKYDLDLAEDLEVRIQKISEEMHGRGIIFRDMSGNLFDFPAIINDMPAYLCWNTSEDDIGHWHYVDEGYAGRKKLTGKESILSFL